MVVFWLAAVFGIFFLHIDSRFKEDMEREQRLDISSQKNVSRIY
jgi:hypothetical protein